jgi:hypothetical protein
MNSKEKKYGIRDKARNILVSIICIVLFFTIIGIPFALVLMQLERIIQLLCEVDEK